MEGNLFRVFPLSQSPGQCVSQKGSVADVPFVTSRTCLTAGGLAPPLTSSSISGGPRISGGRPEDPDLHPRWVDTEEARESERENEYIMSTYSALDNLLNILLTHFI